MTTDGLVAWMRAHRPDPLVCRPHGGIAMFAEHGALLCAGCVRDLRALLADEDAAYRRAIEARLAAVRGCEHTTYVPGCPGACRGFA